MFGGKHQRGNCLAELCLRFRALDTRHSLLVDERIAGGSLSLLLRRGFSLLLVCLSPLSQCHASGAIELLEDFRHRICWLGAVLIAIDPANQIESFDNRSDFDCFHLDAARVLK